MRQRVRAGGEGAGRVTLVPSRPVRRAAAADEAPTTPKPAKPIPLRKGEKRQVLRLAKPYTPSAPSGVGTDDYRCFLLDPKLTHDTGSPATTSCPATPTWCTT